jgi:hypothetical protein
MTSKRSERVGTRRAANAAFLPFDPGRHRMSSPTPTEESADPDGEEFDPNAPLGSDSTQRNRKRAALAVAPFLALGLGNVVLILQWGIEPLWAFALLPPILFCSVLAYIVFSTDFLDDRT